MTSLGINLGGVSQQQQQQQPTPTTPTVSPDVPLSESIFQTPLDVPLQQPQYSPGQLFQTPWADNLDPNSMNVDRGVFEALSSFQPLSVRVGAIHESDNQAPFG